MRRYYFYCACTWTKSAAHRAPANRYLRCACGVLFAPYGNLTLLINYYTVIHGFTGIFYFRRYLAGNTIASLAIGAFVGLPSSVTTVCVSCARGWGFYASRVGRSVVAAAAVARLTTLTLPQEPLPQPDYHNSERRVQWLGVRDNPVRGARTCRTFDGMRDANIPVDAPDVREFASGT